VAGYPVVIGFSVYESFESDQVAKTGIMPIPKASEQMLGGHAVLAIGYIHIKRKPYLICRNSWGTDWGMEGGNFAAPFAWITSTQNAGDFWTCQAVQ
jgi:C1A family cysteine protease